MSKYWSSKYWLSNLLTLFRLTVRLSVEVSEYSAVGTADNFEDALASEWLG